MNILLWILLGLVAGWMASIVTRTNNSQGVGGDIIMGVLGALVGGFVVNLLGGTGITGFNLYSILVAVLGAVILIAIGRAIR